MKEKDVGVALVFTIRDDKGKPMNLSGVKKVSLVARLGGNTFERDCIVVNPTGGVVKYVVQDGDLESAGRLLMEIRIEYEDGRRYTTSRAEDVVEGRLE
ncbi:BppU family phage baseplate upper protein [Caldanaerobius polysaccharolyticus]|uniref:BppU family phage baseplate upper protein n=1 Tax=Caldanaerobius polysaccharolyticus TaxID=44256 RepID=UPI000479DF19|nr:BppU family phage baseplate upper protein [Caldanaerobius polysaccharolyticus]